MRIRTVDPTPDTHPIRAATSWMDAAVASVPRLRDQRIVPGQRWIYSAGFNIDREIRDISRIDCELDDIRFIIEAGGRLAILSHQGSYKDGSARHLDFVAAHLERKLNVPVPYFPENATDGAATRSEAIHDGEVVLFGNTRLSRGEELNDPELARRFARLGQRVAVGGFSKAHRAHASNVGVLEVREGFATRNLLDEIELLGPWAGEDRSQYSVAILGGTKIEKIVIGLAGFTRMYDAVIPGGVVLNTILSCKGHHIGASFLGDNREAALAGVERILGHCDRGVIQLPEEVVVARRSEGRYEDRRVVTLTDGVPRGYAIVDFLVSESVAAHLHRARALEGRVVVAGTPGLYKEGFTAASDSLLRLACDPRLKTILLGGDTGAELPFVGPKSTGGGSALHCLCEGDCDVLKALRLRRTAGSHS